MAYHDDPPVMIYGNRKRFRPKAKMPGLITTSSSYENFYGSTGIPDPFLRTPQNLDLGGVRSRRATSISDSISPPIIDRLKYGINEAFPTVKASEFPDMTQREVKDATAQNIATAAKAMGYSEGIAGAIGSGVNLYQLLKNPLPMMLRPPKIDEVRFDSSVTAVGAALEEQNRQALASGLAERRALGEGNTEGIIAASLRSNLAVAGIKSEIISEDRTLQVATNAQIRTQNAQMALDYGVYVDDYRREERDRKDQIRNSILNTLMSVPADIIQKSSDAAASIAKLYMGGGF